MRAGTISGTVLPRSEGEYIGVPLHADHAWLPQPFPEHNCVATICLPCEGMTEAEGATRVALGSHRHRRLPSPAEAAQTKNHSARGSEKGALPCGPARPGTRRVCAPFRASAPCCMRVVSASTRSPSRTTRICCATRRIWPLRPRGSVAWSVPTVLWIRKLDGHRRPREGGEDAAHGAAVSRAEREGSGQMPDPKGGVRELSDEEFRARGSSCSALTRS